MTSSKKVMLVGFYATPSLKVIIDGLAKLEVDVSHMILCKSSDTANSAGYEKIPTIYESDLYDPDSKIFSNINIDFKELEIFRHEHALLLRCMSRWESTFTNVDDKIYLIDKLFSFYLKTLKESKVEYILYSTGSPHHFYDLILFLAAESLGIKSIFQLTNPLTNRTRFVYSLEYKTIDIEGVGSDDNKMYEYLASLVNQKEISADWKTQALRDPTKTNIVLFSLKRLPRYMARAVKNVLNPQKNIYIYSNEFKVIKTFKILSFIIRSVINIHRTKKLYQSLETSNLTDKSLVMYSHFQPEATSHPDGGYYADMRYWYSYLKGQYPIVYYKEHVANFLFHDSFEMTNSLAHRSRDYYLDLHNQGAKLLNVHYSTRKIFNQGCSIFTFTGTVILEAVMNGIEVTYPGNPWFGTLPNTEYAINGPGVKLKVIKKGSLEELNAYFKKQDKSSFPNVFGWNTGVKDESITLEEYCTFIHKALIKMDNLS